MTRFLLSTAASVFLLAAPVAAIAQTPAPATPAPATTPAPAAAATPAKPATPAKTAAKPAAKAAAKPTHTAAAKPAMKPMAHHAAMHRGAARTSAGDAAVDQLNEQSLAKARSGQ